MLLLQEYQSIERLLYLDIRKMMLSPLTQPAVRPLYNGGSKSAARGTPSFEVGPIFLAQFPNNTYTEGENGTKF